MAAFTVHAGAATSLYWPGTTTILLSGRRRGALRVSCSAAGKTVVIGQAADSECGKCTFMRRLTSVLGGTAEPPKGGNPDSNTLISDTTTVICLDDLHSLDRTGRKEKGVTALDPRANDFDLMYEQVKAIKEGQAVEKPIYNHVTGLLDPPELITLHAPQDPSHRGTAPNASLMSVRGTLLDINNEVKFAWKIQSVGTTSRASRPVSKPGNPISMLALTRRSSTPTP